MKVYSREMNEKKNQKSLIQTAKKLEKKSLLDRLYHKTIEVTVPGFYVSVIKEEYGEGVMNGESGRDGERGRKVGRGREG